MEYIIEKERKTPVVDTVDVFVAGGGFAGASAALAAARQGKKVLLCQREFMLGGLGTAGIITIYLPLDDGRGNQVSFGIAEELLKLSMHWGIEGKNPMPWLENGTKEERIKNRYQVQYNPWVFIHDLELLLDREGVEILYGSLVADTVVEDGKIRYVIVENIDGRVAYRVKAVVDGTGDAVVCRLAGEDTVDYEPGNYASYWYYYHTQGQVKLKGSRNEAFVGSGLDARQNSRWMIESRAIMAKELDEAVKESPDIRPTAVPTIPGFRMTRRIVGVEDVLFENGDKYMPTSIGCFGDWTKAGPAYEVPFGSLYGRKVKNLITAGRSISADDKAWWLSRVIPVCAVTGEAAGIAAALSDDFANLPIEVLQKALEEKGVKLHL